MQTNLFHFDLPEKAIAQHPLEPRDSAKMLVVDGSKLVDDTILNLADYFASGDVIIFNNTKVIPTRLSGFKKTGAKIEFTLHKKKGHTSWHAFAKPARKAPLGSIFNFSGDVQGQIIDKGDNGEVIIDFNLKATQMLPWLEQYADLPLPPYIRGGQASKNDTDRYQTIYAKNKGAVAAPTAGLHFTERLFKALDDKGIIRKEVTLHVGAGTFLPVKAQNIKDHQMHAEWGQVSQDVVDAICKAKQQGRRVYAIGTTSLRLLESAYNKQKNKLDVWEGETDIFIYPGYQFKVIDGLLTNFHLPSSTLFMLVSAMSGFDHMKKAYAHAIQNDYRFYSYGDCCLLKVDAAGRNIPKG